MLSALLNEDGCTPSSKKDSTTAEISLSLSRTITFFLSPRDHMNSSHVPPPPQAGLSALFVEHKFPHPTLHLVALKYLFFGTVLVVAVSVFGQKLTHREIFGVILFVFGVFFLLVSLSNSIHVAIHVSDFAIHVLADSGEEEERIVAIARYEPASKIAGPFRVVQIAGVNLAFGSYSSFTALHPILDTGSRCLGM